MTSACNQVFGLSETLGPDSDGDGDLDGNDNCALVGNPDQRDRDGDSVGDACDPCVEGPQLGVDDDRDGVDDACDPCLTGSNLDEDGDTYLDGCDACPGRVDDQVDDDSDGVGNACDFAPGALDHRVMFDGFAPPRPNWNTAFSDWTVGDAGFGPAYMLSGNFVGAWNPDAPITNAADWWVETAIHIPPEVVSDGMYILVVGLTEIGANNGTECGVSYSAGRWTVRGTTMPIVIGEEIQIRLRVLPVGGHQCIIDGKVVRSSTMVQVNKAWFAVLSTTGRAEFRWVDIVE